MSTTVDYAHTTRAEQNRAAKAHALAVHAWRHGMTSAHLRGMDDPTRREFARDATVRQPSGETWVVAAERLSVLWQHADSPTAPPQDLMTERARWGQDDAEAVDTTDAPQAPALLEHDGTAPRGWDELVALGPLTGFDRPPRCAVCRTTPAIVGLVDGWRCAAHPPRAGEWGHLLDMTPRAQRGCTTVRCYCGRCSTYAPLGPVKAPAPDEDSRRFRR